MVRILLGLITLLAIAAGVLSLKAKSTVASAKEQLQQVQNDAATHKQAAEKAKTDLSAVQEAVAAEKAAKEAIEKEIAAAKAAAEKAASDLEAAVAQVQEKETELVDLRAKVVASTEAPVTNEADTAELEAKLKEALSKLEEQTQVARSLEAKSAAAEERAAALENEKQRRAQGLSAPGLEGKVLAVDPGWNFVVLSIGDRQGVAPNSTMLVKRGDNLIGRVRVSKVERGTSIANVIGGSIAKGASIRPGDIVIFSGGTAATSNPSGS